VSWDGWDSESVDLVILSICLGPLLRGCMAEAAMKRFRYGSGSCFIVARMPRCRVSHELTFFDACAASVYSEKMEKGNKMRSLLKRKRHFIA
jgi:hypothetical protein